MSARREGSESKRASEWGAALLRARACVAKMSVAAARVKPSRTVRGMRVMSLPMRPTPRRKRITPTWFGSVKESAGTESVSGETVRRERCRAVC